MSYFGSNARRAGGEAVTHNRVLGQLATRPTEPLQPDRHQKIARTQIRMTAAMATLSAMT